MRSHRRPLLPRPPSTQRTPALTPLALLVFGLFPLGAPSHAVIIPVTTTADVLADGDGCGLREAIQAANADAPVHDCPAGSGADVIQLATGVASYPLSLTGPDEDLAASGDIDVTTAVTVVGTNATDTVIDATAAADRAFHVLAGGVLTLQQLQVTGGTRPRVNDFANNGGCILNVGALTIQSVRITGCEGRFGGGISSGGALSVTDSQFDGNLAFAGRGGAIHTQGTLTVNGTRLTDNTASFFGGALAVGAGTATLTSSRLDANHTTAGFGAGAVHVSGGTLTTERSTIDGNDCGAGRGGGLTIESGTATLRNVTVSGNLARGGAGISAQQGGPDPVVVTLENCTVTGNQATRRAGNTGGVGGGIESFNATVTLSNTLVGGNVNFDGAPDCAGTLTSAGHNLVVSHAGCTVNTASGDLTDVDPLLDPLQLVGGTTPTHLPASVSPLVDAGGDDCEPTDQRGTVRPQGTACDIGAVERTAGDPDPTPSTTTTTTPPTTTTSTTLVISRQLCPPDVAGTIRDPRFVIAGLGGKPGNETLRISGALDLQADAPLDLAASGAQIALLNDNTEALLFGLTLDTRPIPPGKPGTGCRKRDGWRGTTYVNVSGRLDPPTCTPDSALGLRLLRFKDRRAKGGGIRFLAKVPRTTLTLPEAFIGKLVVVLGTTPEDGEAGRCAVHAFDGGDCTTKPSRISCP